LLHACKHVGLLGGHTETLTTAKGLLLRWLRLLTASVKSCRPLVLLLLLRCASHRILSTKGTHATAPEALLLLLLHRTVEELRLEATLVGSWLLRWLLHTEWVGLRLLLLVVLLLLLLLVLHHLGQLLLLLHALLGCVELVHQVEGCVFRSVRVRAVRLVQHVHDVIDLVLLLWLTSNYAIVHCRLLSLTTVLESRKTVV